MLKRNRGFDYIPYIVIPLVLLFGGACSDSPPVEERGVSYTDDIISFSMLYADNASYGYNPDWPVLERMTELTGVRLDITPVPEADWNYKRQAVLSSGNIPDIIAKTFATDVSDYSAAGLILPINLYMDRMPHFSGFVEDVGLERELDNMREADGNFYGLPVMCFTEKLQQQIWSYRKDILEEHGIPVPHSFDELLKVSRELKNLYPDSYPLTNRFGSDNLLSTIAPAFGTNAGWGLGAAGFDYDGKRDEWIFAPGTDEYKSMLQWLNLMMGEGLLDPEFATLDSNVYEKRIESGNTFFMVDWMGNEIRYQNEGRKEEPRFSIVPMMPPAGPDGIRSLRAAAQGSQGWVVPSRVAEEESFDRFLEFLDWFYSDEGTDLFAWGLEGETYRENDGGGKSYLPEIREGKKDPAKDYGFLNNCFTVVYPVESYLARFGEESREIIRRITESDMVPDIGPKLRPEVEELERINMLQAGLGDYVDYMTLQFIYGETSFDEWDEYLEQCRIRGSEELDRLINIIWERQNSMRIN